MEKTYLGDSVYAAWNDYGQFVLTVENGYGPTHTIFLENETLAALDKFVTTICKTHDLKKPY